MANTQQTAATLQLRELSLTTNVVTAIVESQFFRAVSWLVPGATIVFANVVTNTFLNNNAYVLTSVTAAPVTRGIRFVLVFGVTHADVLPMGDSGDIVVRNQVPDPGPRPASDAQFPAWVRKDMESKASQLQTPSDGGRGVSHP